MVLSSFLGLSDENLYSCSLWLHIKSLLFLFHADVTVYDQCKKGVEAVIQKLGNVDILVNNAGISGAFATVDEYPIEVWDKVIDTNLRSCFYMSRAVVPHFKARFESLKPTYDWSKPDEVPHIGAIVSIASVAGRQGWPTLAPYAGGTDLVEPFLKILFVCAL